MRKHSSHTETEPETSPNENETYFDPTMPNHTASGRKGKGKVGPIRRIMNGWWDRLLGAASAGSLSDQEEEYESHRTTRDYIWNTVGYSAWGMVFPILTIVVTQLVGVEQAGMFSMGFVVANLLYYLGNYGVRTYQVSDINGEHAFKDYQVHRVITCAFMIIAGYLYCVLRGYATEMLTMCMGIYAFKMIDALGDVYEGRLQQVDKLYLGGISLTIRSVFAFLAFTIALLITRNLGISAIVMAVAAFVTFALVTFPLALIETPKSTPFSLASVGRLFKQCTPLFVALFLYALIDNMPKFVMEGVLTYDNQLYFNALYFPAQAVLLMAGFIYKPLLVRMANAWADVEHRRRFDLFIVAMMAIIVVLTVLGILIMGWIGIPIMSFLYGIDFTEFTTLSFIMLAAGGITAGIDFLYQVITILRRQKVVTELYLITFAFSLIILIGLINMEGLDGAVMGYLIVMCILFVLLLREYIIVRLGYARERGNFESSNANSKPTEQQSGRTAEGRHANSQLVKPEHGRKTPPHAERNNVVWYEDEDETYPSETDEERAKARARLEARMNRKNGER